MKELQRLREKARLTQRDLSVILAVHIRTIKRWEEGVTVPSPSRLKELAIFFSVTVKDLMEPEKNNA